MHHGNTWVALSIILLLLYLSRSCQSCQERLTFGTVTTMKEVRVKTCLKIFELTLALGSTLNLGLSVYCPFATFAKVHI